MRVGLAIHQATAVLRGGPRTQVLQTAAGLRDLGVETRLLDSWTELRPGDVDLVHIFGAGMGSYHLARALHLQGIPTVVSPIYITRRSPAVVRLIRRLGRIARPLVPGLWHDYDMISEMCSWAVFVAPNTEDEAALFRDAFGVERERLAVVPNGVEERFRRGDAALFRTKYGLERYILSTGHVGPARKNVRRLVEALEGLDRPAVIIGRIEETAEARAILDRSRRNPNLLILDHIDHDDPMLASAYAGCEVFALPSLFETPGIAALEAGLAGAKVVITPHGGTREYFGPLADYVDPYSTGDIRRGIRAALDKPRTPDLANHLASQYLWPRIAELTLKLYERVLAR